MRHHPSLLLRVLCGIAIVAVVVSSSQIAHSQQSTAGAPADVSIELTGPTAAGQYTIALKDSSGKPLPTNPKELVKAGIGEDPDGVDLIQKDAEKLKKNYAYDPSAGTIKFPSHYRFDNPFVRLQFADGPTKQFLTHAFKVHKNATPPGTEVDESKKQPERAPKSLTDELGHAEQDANLDLARFADLVMMTAVSTTGKSWDFRFDQAPASTARDIAKIFRDEAQYIQKKGTLTDVEVDERLKDLRGKFNTFYAAADDKELVGNHRREVWQPFLQEVDRRARGVMKEKENQPPKDVTKQASYYVVVLTGLAKGFDDLAAHFRGEKLRPYDNAGVNAGAAGGNYEPRRRRAACFRLLFGF